jgi:hypothetical protein
MQLKHTKPNTFQTIMIQASALPGPSHVIADMGQNCGVIDRDKHEPTVQKI